MLCLNDGTKAEAAFKLMSQSRLWRRWRRRWGWRWRFCQKQSKRPGLMSLPRVLSKLSSCYPAVQGYISHFGGISWPIIGRLAKWGRKFRWGYDPPREEEIEENKRDECNIIEVEEEDESLEKDEDLSKMDTKLTQRSIYFTKEIF